MNIDRIILSVFWIPILLLSFVLGQEIHLFSILLAVCCLGLLEFITMCRHRGINPPGFLTMIGGVAVLIAAVFFGAGAGLAIAMLVTLGAFAAFPMSGRAEGTVTGASTVALALIWIPLPLAHIMYLRNLPHGGWLLVLLYGIIWASDSGAYFSGKLTGSRKLLPSVSPHKTVEGTIGGIIAGIICALFVGYLMQDILPLTFVATLVLGITIPIVGLFGDLAESAFKRDVGVKDSGSIMGSHGGALDRFDSNFFAAPAAWYLIALMKDLGIIVWV